MSKKDFFKEGPFFCLSLFLAIAGVYSYASMSVIMPVLTLLLVWQRGGVKKILSHMSSPFVFLFLFLLLGGVGILWAKHPPTALKIFLTTGMTAVFSFFFIAALKEAKPALCMRVYKIVKITAFILFTLILVQNTLDEFHIRLFRPFVVTYMMKPSGSILGLSAFMGCGLAWAYGEKFLAGATFILLLLLIYLTQCNTAFYGIFFACGVFVISYLAPVWATRLAVVASYTCLILTPLFFLLIAPLLTNTWVLSHPSFAHRAMGWSFLAEKFRDNPIFGWGVGSTPHLPDNSNLVEGFCHLIHPHKSSLQAYVELGIGGGILFALFFAALFRMVEKYVKDSLSVAVCNATIAFAFVQAEVTHSLWHNHWISWAALLAGLLMVFLKAREAQLHAQGGHSKPSPALSRESGPQQFPLKKVGPRGASS